MDKYKRCSGCKELKPISDFGNNASTKDGFGIYCTPCRKLVYQRATYYYNRNKALEKTSGRCAICNESRGVIVHHIIPKSKRGNNDLENLIPLCKKCHLKAHNGKYYDLMGIDELIKLKTST